MKIGQFFESIFKKNYIKQDDPRLNKEMQESGCFVRSCMHIAEIEAGKVLTAAQIESIHKKIIEKKHVATDKTTVLEPAQIINETFKCLNVKKRARQIGIFKNGRLEYWVPEEMQINHHFIQKINTYNEKYKTHFWNVDYKGHVTFNPHSSDIRVKSVEYSTIYYIDEV